MRNKTKTKNFVISLAMATMMLLPLTTTAQYDESRYGLQPWFGSSVMGREPGGNREGNGISGDISNWGLGQNDTPLGSGIAILLTAGLGYVALKKKEDER